jgi:hypothetical protein
MHEISIQENPNVRKSENISAPCASINAIHMYSGLKADLYPVREGDELLQSVFQRREQVDHGPPIGKVCRTCNHSR